MVMAAEPKVAVAAPPSPEAIVNTESYTDFGKNPWVDASKDHLSTFAADVDTASYTIARKKLEAGTLFRLIGFNQVMKNLPVVGPIAKIPVTLAMNLRMLIEDRITPPEIRDTNASVYVTLSRKPR